MRRLLLAWFLATTCVAQSIDLDGSTQYCETDTAVRTSYPLVVCGWVYRDTDVDGTVFWLGDKDASNEWIQMRVDAGTDLLECHAQGGGGAGEQAVSSSTLSTATWYHCCCVFASDTSRTAYLNGVAGTEDTTAEGTTASTWDRTALGRTADSSPGNNFDGKLAWFAVWSGDTLATEPATFSEVAVGVIPLGASEPPTISWPLWLGTCEDEQSALTLAETGSPTQSALGPNVFGP